MFSVWFRGMHATTNHMCPTRKGHRDPKGWHVQLHTTFAETGCSNTTTLTDFTHTARCLCARMCVIMFHVLCLLIVVDVVFFVLQRFPSNSVVLCCRVIVFPLLCLIVVIVCLFFKKKRKCPVVLRAIVVGMMSDSSHPVIAGVQLGHEGVPRPCGHD